EGSGLARPQIYNWPQRLSVLLETRQVDIAVVFIGANDARDIRRDGEILPFNSPQWIAAYNEALDKVMGQFKAARTAVYWLELPPVARQSLDEKLAIVARLQKQAAARNGIRYIEIRKTFTTPDGQYTRFGENIYGEPERLRNFDGIRFITQGNNKLAQIVLKAINTDIAIADGARPESDFPSPGNAVAGSDSNPGSTGPLFGSLMSDGSIEIVKSSDLPEAGDTQVQSASHFTGENPPAPAGSRRPRDILSALRKSARPGSAASRLFTMGVWSSPQRGRIDDFRVR
ncbi:MAG TPA: DUF459 domain-containing protein, partial [Rhizobiales bacterium]|nr:DUF459 domain-containing protein [Hyphomicrobiales bacterium]